MIQRKPRAFDEQQREFWGALNDYIRENQGFIVSEPHTVNVRFECRPDCDLPELLKAKGYDLNSAGTNERLMPIVELVREHGGTREVIREHIEPQAVAVYEFKLPFG